VELKSLWKKPQKKKKEDEYKFDKDPKALGKDAPTVFRDKHGRKLESLNEFVRQAEGIPSADKEKNMKWGIGEVDEEVTIEHKRAEYEKEKDKPFIRTIDDEDLNEYKKHQLVWGDPMAESILKKKRKQEKKIA